MDKRRQAMLLRLEGQSYAKIGKALGVSAQYIQQITRPPAPVYEHVKKKAEGRCQKCGITVRDGQVCAGKRCLDSGSYYIDKLSYLCASCHRRAHPEALKTKKEQP